MNIVDHVIPFAIFVVIVIGVGYSINTKRSGQRDSGGGIGTDGSCDGGGNGGD